MAAYLGVAAYVATTVTGGVAFDLEMDVPVGSLLVLIGPAGHGGTSVGPETKSTWNPTGDYYYVANVTDTQSNEWGYAMTASPYLADNTMGTAPMTLVATALEAGTDQITVDIEVFDVAVASPGFVARVLCFSGFTAVSPNNGMPIADVIPVFNTPWNGTSFFGPPDPGDAIPLPALVNPGLSAFGTDSARQNAGDPLVLDPRQVGALLASYPSPAQTLWLASIAWDGTVPPWDYYYVTGAADPSPGFVPATQPGGLGLSADHGTFYFDAYVPEFADDWVDLGYDTIGTTIESRFAYLIQTTPIPDGFVDWYTPYIGANFDVGDGTWGGSYDQEQDATSFPFAAGSYSPPPSFPLGSPNTITAPVWPTLQFMEGYATGTQAAAGIYATVAKGGATTGTGTFDPDTMVGISHVRQRGGAQ